MTSQQIIDLLKLEPLKGEGGYYRQTYKRFVGQESSTAIFYLVDQNSFSRFHRLLHDEIFHFYLGDAVNLVEMDSLGALQVSRLGPKIENGECVQKVVMAGHWQGLKLCEGGQWALLGTTMSPGFQESEFELGLRQDLLKQFPQHRAWIEKLTVNGTDT
jgi:predicted cupin superfamily sugar epimerase